MNPGKRMPSKISVVFMRSFMLVLPGAGLWTRESVTQCPSSFLVQASLPFHHQDVEISPHPVAAGSALRGHYRTISEPWPVSPVIGAKEGPGPIRAYKTQCSGSAVCLDMRVWPVAWQNSSPQFLATCMQGCTSVATCVIVTYCAHPWGLGSYLFLPQAVEGMVVKAPPLLHILTQTPGHLFICNLCCLSESCMHMGTHMYAHELACLCTCRDQRSTSCASSVTLHIFF